MKNPFKKENLQQEVISLSLHSENKLSRTIKIKKGHLYAGAAALLIVAAGSVNYYITNQNRLVATAKQLESTSYLLKNITDMKNQLEIKSRLLESKSQLLETENKAYNNQLDGLKTKAQEIENKLNELNGEKDALYNKLDTVGLTPDAVEAAGTNTSALETGNSTRIAPDVEETFTTVILTPFHCENTNTEYLAAAFNQLETTLAMEELEFVDVAQDVTQTLARVTSNPSGWPVYGQVSSEYGYRDDPFGGSSEYHSGMDIRTPIGTPVKATASGRVVQSEYNNSGYGYMVEIDHGNGLRTLYAHNFELLVAVGEQIEKGQTIALSGATGRVTGPHVHYEVRLHGELQNPREYMN